MLWRICKGVEKTERIKSIGCSIGFRYVSNKSFAKIKSPLDEILEDKKVNNNELKNN